MESTQWRMRLFMVVLEKEGELTQYLETKEDQHLTRFPHLRF